jgi:hypothetical protein
MRRILAPAVGLAVLLAPTAHAAPKPQLTDARGDWQTAGQDVLSGRLSSVRGDTGPMVQGELQLAAPPSVPGTIYRFTFHLDCHEYSFAYEVPGAEDSSLGAPNQPGMNYDDNCAGLPGPEASYRATAEVRGNVIVWRAPYVGHIQRGAVARRFEALACFTLTCGMSVTQTGDTAASAGYYAVGSDLPRR